ncbi:MAG: PAS domain S-box protein, partial [Gammaproteobacteria bacterium]
MNKETIKQLKQLEDKYGELSSSRENLLVTLNSIGDAVIATDINGDVNYLNLVAEKLTGWTLEDALNKPLADVFHIVNAQTKEPAFNPVKQVLENGQVVGLANHTQLIARDGAEYHIADSAAPIKNSNGQIIGVVLVFRDVSSEYAVRTALEESENRYKNLFENAEISIWNEDFSKVYQALDQLRLEGVTDLSLYFKNNPQAAWDMTAMARVLQVNQATLKLFGAGSNEEFIPQIGKIFGHGAIDVFIGGLCAYWENKRVFRAEVDFHTLDGRDINTIISYQIPEVAEGYKSIAVSILDITERKQMEQALQESEEKYRTLYDNAPLAYQSLDEQGNFIDINPAWLNTLGFNMDEVVGKNFGDFLHPDWQAHFAENFPKFKRAGCVHGVHFKIRHKNGHYLDIEFEGCIGYTAEGKFKQTYCVFQDVTKRKQAEDALRESEVHMRTLVETLPDLIWLKNPQGVYLNCNPKFERFFGAKQSEIVGKTDYDFVNKELADFFRQNDRAVMTSGNARVNEEEVSFADDGHIEQLETIKTPMLDADGRIIGVLGVGRDITERKQTEQALRRSQKMDAVGQLTGGIAHDFNNIINVILGNLELLKRQIPDDETSQKRINNIHKSAQRAADL